MSLVNAILYENKEDVAECIAQGANVNEMDVYGFTPLIESVIVNKIDIAEYLLQQGAYVNQTDVTGRTALHWSVENHNLAFVKLLLHYKADANAYTFSSQPVLVVAILRHQENIKRLLVQHGAQLAFAQDFINSKLLGHRFELAEQIDIANHKDQLIPLNLEGFFMEFSLDVMTHSLECFKHHFLARQLRQFFIIIEYAMHALRNATNLTKFQDYSLDLKEYDQHIDALLSHEPLIIPVGYEGHAATFLKWGNLFAKCDRREASQSHGSAVVYKVNNPGNLNKQLFKHILYKKQDENFIEQGVNQYLGLKPIAQLPLPYQISGNCSWANVEASLATLALMTFMKHKPTYNANDMINFKRASLYIHEQWAEWDKDRALYECIQRYDQATPIRKVSIISLLAAIVFYRCDHRVTRDLERAERIFPLITNPEFAYILQSYIDVYYRQNKTEQGRNLIELLSICGY
jgi:hypothetical protein